MRMFPTLALACAALAGCGADGRYQIAADGQSTGVWRLDTRTGAVTVCDFWDDRKITCRDSNPDEKTSVPQTSQRM